MKKHNLKSFLKATYYCDCENYEIQKIAKYFMDNSSNSTELAKKLFYFVRDSTVYKVGHWTKKASDTLKEKGGTCTNNANLLIALLRAANIPAGYGVMDVVGPDYFGPIVLPHLARNVSRKSKHVYCNVYLNNKWIKCDPSDDEPLSVNTAHLNPQSKVVEWNGLSDAMLNLNPNHIIKDEGPFSNIDHIISKKMKHRRRIPVYVGNLYIQFLREEGKNILNICDIENLFSLWLLKKHSLVFVLYRIYFMFDSQIRRICSNIFITKLAKQ
ncbi:MAG: transglutaminase family protein [Candidatus Paceibacterota bacterium]|jgi:hypothetical protein